MADSNFNNESSNNIPGAEVNKLNASSYQPNSEPEIQIKKENTTESIDSASQTQLSSQKNEPLGRSLNLSMTNSDAESKNLPKISPIVNNKASSELNEPSSATSLYNPQNNATESQEQTQSKKKGSYNGRIRFDDGSIYPSCKKIQILRATFYLRILVPNQTFFYSGHSFPNFSFTIL
ncbi:hypothetical protein DSO57_1029775 [Entomophthora muscae]|uniref:Uncharacterized protein n=1 Tax=Entomophthora muscae TaxID=34485 RepID=A0ACC2S395_9FUNG|nr:hypothetical protein DSO57_1029775 [Entomophthora muscae]